MNKVFVFNGVHDLQLALKNEKVKTNTTLWLYSIWKVSMVKTPYASCGRPLPVILITI